MYKYTLFWYSFQVFPRIFPEFSHLLTLCPPFHLSSCQPFAWSANLLFAFYWIVSGEETENEDETESFSIPSHHLVI